jgi:hypothetical protein
VDGRDVVGADDIVEVVDGDPEAAPGLPGVRPQADRILRATTGDMSEITNLDTTVDMAVSRLPLLHRAESAGARHSIDVISTTDGIAGSNMSPSSPANGGIRANVSATLEMVCGFATCPLRI